MDISITVRETADALVLTVTGRLDAEHADELARAVDDELRRGHHALALDLIDCGFLSSAGIRVLFEINRAAERVGGRCRIRAASPPVRKVLDLTRLSPLLMESAPPAAVLAPAVTPSPDHTSGAIRWIGLESPTAPVAGRVVGSDTALSTGRHAGAPRLAFPGDCFALGLGALAEDLPLSSRAGEVLAAGGIAFHRRPRPFSIVDYVTATGDLVAELDVGHGLVWRGVPSGRAGFEMATEEPIAIDDLATQLLDSTAADTVALVVAGEVHGLVGAELIRPLSEITADDRPGVADRTVAARWLSFSREPVHARRAAIVVGVATRGAAGSPLASFVRPLGGAAPAGHFHAVVFPPRPLKRGPGDLAATVADLAASPPLALLHLLTDPQPVLGSGRPTLARGRCWFAPLTIGREAA